VKSSRDRLYARLDDADLQEVSSRDGLGEKSSGGLGEQLTQAAVVAELEHDGDTAVDEVMCQQRDHVLVLQRLVDVHLNTAQSTLP